MLPFKARPKTPAPISGTVLLHATDTQAVAPGATLQGAVILACTPPAVLTVHALLHGMPIVVTFTGDSGCDVVANHPVLAVLEPVTVAASVADCVLISMQH